MELKYEGYLRRQQAAVDEQRRLEGRRLPSGTDYGGIPGLRLEAREKLAQIRPGSIGQASRISGVSRRMSRFCSSGCPLGKKAGKSRRAP